MSQKNTLPEAATYVLGRGKMFFSNLGTNGMPVGFRFVGNCPEVTATLESESYEHFRSTGGLKQKDLDIIISQALKWTATLENMDKDNLGIFFAAEHETSFVNPAITGFAGVVLVPAGSMVSEATGGRWYQLYDATGRLCIGAVAAKVALVSTNLTPASLVKDTDYTLDVETGRVFFLNSAKVQTIITNAEGVKATVTADAGAKVVNKLGAGSKGETNVAVRFELINAQSDAVELIFEIHKAGVTPNGDVNFISDEVAQLPLTIAVEQNDAFENPMDIYDLR